MQLADCNTALAAEREAHQKTCAELHAFQRELQDARESASSLEQMTGQLERVVAEKLSLEESLEALRAACAHSAGKCPFAHGTFVLGAFIMDIYGVLQLAGPIWDFSVSCNSTAGGIYGPFSLLLQLFLRFL